MNGLTAIRQICNNHQVGHIITRQDLVNICSINLSESTIDHYRRMLTVLGYLSHTGLGKYVLVKRIPKMTTSQLRRRYDIIMQSK